MTSDEYRDLTRDFLNDSLKSAKTSLHEQLENPGLPPEDVDYTESFNDSLFVIDVDSGDRVNISITVNYDMVSVRFGNSMTISLNADDAQGLGNILNNAAIALSNG